jgi:hypothetical protein
MTESTTQNPNQNPHLPPLPETTPKTNRWRTRLFLGIVTLLLCYGILRMTGILQVNSTAGGFSIEEITVTNEEDDTGLPNIAATSQKTFPAIGRIHTVVKTSGVDATVGVRWFHEDIFLHEGFARTKDNLAAFYLEGKPQSPLPAGNYRVEVVLGKEAIHDTYFFTVEPFLQEVIPAFPTPNGHESLEKSLLTEIPFAFDETWVMPDGKEWQINEVKIVFLQETLFVVVVKSDVDFSDMTKEEIEALAKPIAKYSIENGYLDQAKTIQINGKTYDFTEPLSITLMLPETGQGYRARFDIDEFLP